MAYIHSKVKGSEKGEKDRGTKAEGGRKEILFESAKSLQRGERR